ncbi:MAG TPA: phosphoribosylformylglycinamidine synthase subunit PurQ [Candidatus Bathyarchaeia archaeon]|nr:phosphoribosylformylglycinamidine synthase subunit PurQ [Candidatus Bathyarchaeia archaeon]
MKVAVIQFPGSNCDRDTLQVLQDNMKIETKLVWHNEFKDDVYDAVILPGGFSFGDHLRGGIIAAHSPAMQGVRKMAKEGKPVLGICNGFQILIESELLPGSLLRNSSLKFVCKWMDLQVDNVDTAFTCAFERGEKVRMPIAHNEGRFFGEDQLLNSLKADNRVLLHYLNENPTGTSEGIVSISNKEGNVVGMMSHPERASDDLLGGTDGLRVFGSMLEWMR